MGAFNEGGIPHAFVVDQKGRLVWHGHPMNGLDQVVAKVVDGTFDLTAAKKVAALQQLIPEYFNAVAKGKPSPEVAASGTRIVEEGAADPNMLNEFAWTILTHPAIAHRDLELAIAAAKKAFDETKGQDPSIMDTYARALFDTGKVAEAIAMEKKAIAACQDADLKEHLQESLQLFEKGAAK
jgi:hypothetical protein